PPVFFVPLRLRHTAWDSIQSLKIVTLKLSFYQCYQKKNISGRKDYFFPAVSRSAVPFAKASLQLWRFHGEAEKALNFIPRAYMIKLL
ncbi:MAG: hypothetical protein LUC85_04955, partial [Bacteroidales bacterium]|nr:hypothetical protein [Bacteroidales bacterium]